MADALDFAQCLKVVIGMLEDVQSRHDIKCLVVKRKVLDR